MHSIEYKILSIIYGRGRGWAFSQKDFAHLGGRSSIDLALHRLLKKKTIRRVIRGIYDYPFYSNRLKQNLSPDIDKVTQAIARKFGWHIQPSGPAALNILGLSTQVPGKYLYLSNGPNRTYIIDMNKIIFKNAPTKEAGFKLYESAIIIQALKSLGNDQITPKVIRIIRKWLDPKLRSRITQDTRTVTSWAYEAIRLICQEDYNG